MPSILFAHADFVVQRRDAVLRDAFVLVDGCRIRSIGTADPVPPQGEEVLRVDCRGWILLPGLINAHSHLYQILMRGLGKRYALFDWIAKLTYPVARQLSASDHSAAVLLASMDAFRNGTTSIVDMPTHYARFHADAVMGALQTTGVRGAVARAASDSSTVDPGENRRPEEDLRAAQAFLQRWSGVGIVQAWLGPSGIHAASSGLLQEMKRVATRHGARFHIHLGESLSGRDLARRHGHVGEVAWADSLSLLDPLTSVAHGVWVSDAEVNLLKRSGAQLVHNPNSNQVLASGAANLVKMRANAVPLALGSDGPASNDSLDMFAEMKSAVLLQRVNTLDPLALTAGDAFEMCTEGGAAVLGLPDLGRLEVGCLADLVAVNTRENPSLTPVYDPVESLVYHASGRDVVLTMVNGRVVYQEGRYPTLDAQAVFGQIRRIAERLQGGILPTAP